MNRVESEVIAVEGLLNQFRELERWSRQMLKLCSILVILGGLALLGGPSVQTAPLAEDYESIALEAPPLEKYVLRVPEEYATIQAAIDAAAEGATVLIGAGLYKENIQITKSLRLLGLGQEQVQIQAADESRPIVYVFSKTPIQVYFQGFTLGDPTVTIEQILLRPRIRPQDPFLPPPRTGLFMAGLIQAIIRHVTVGGQQEGGIASLFPRDIKNDIVLFSLQAPAILQGVHLLRNGVGVALEGEGLILQSTVEENIVGVLGGGRIFVYQSVVRGNRQVGLFLPVWSRGLLLGEIRDNDITQNGIGMYLSALFEKGRWVEISENRLTENQHYAIVIQDPACPYVTGDPLPAPLEKSALIEIVGFNNEIQNNAKGSLCPADYPWPPGFRK